MSKAFLRESDFEELPELPTPVATLPAGVRNLMTAEGAAKLREQLLQLVENQRPPLAAKIVDPEIRRELQALDQRIRGLEESLRIADIIASDELDSERVRFGSRVTVAEENGATATYHIVGVDETELHRDALSWRSPLARALMNARVGDKVTLQAPGGRRDLRVLNIDRGGSSPTPA